MKNRNSFTDLSVTPTPRNNSKKNLLDLILIVVFVVGAIGIFMIAAEGVAKHVDAQTVEAVK